MSYRISPAEEYRLLDDWYSSSSTDNMPPELEMREKLYKTAWYYLKKGVFRHQKIAAVLQKEHSEYNLSPKAALNHVQNAAKYYTEKNTETADLHRARLVDALYRMKEELEHTVFKYKPLETGREIRAIIEQIAKMTGVDRPSEPNTDNVQSVSLILSDSAKDIPGLPEISIDKLISEVQKMQKVFELSEVEVQQIIQRDINGSI